MKLTRSKRKTRQQYLLPALAVFSMAIAPSVHAQSNSAGSIFGKVENGDTIVVENVDTGLIREISVGDDGRYNASALPIGNYVVRLENDGEVVETRSDVLVRIGSGSNVSFTDDFAELAAVQVSAASVAPVDVSTTDTRVVFTAEQLENIPVGRSIQDVALLTPGVVEADSRYPDTASFGGSAASENAFYINGYAVTNPLTNLGSTSLPFGSISQFQAITGGYGAEFGRATGGVVNIQTKSGSNEYHAGALLIFEPKSLRSDQKDIYFPENGTALDGVMYRKYSERTVDSMTTGVYASGPIVEDKLFFYINGEYENREVNGVDPYPGSGVAGYNLDIGIPRYLAKFDWNITNDHLLDFTAISDVKKQTDSYYDYYYNAGNDAGLPPFVRGDVQNGGYEYKDGGELYIAKYTGYLTNDLTVSAMYGQQKQDHTAVPFMYDPTVTYVSDSRPIANQVRAGSYAQLPFPDAYDETSGYRLDLEWRVDDHTLRFGYDRQDSESKAGEVTSGPGYRWRYETVGANPADDTIPGSGGASVPSNASGDYAVRYIYANGGTFSVEQDAFYLEDTWQINYNWLARIGLRNERFTNYNADGVPYVEQDDQWAPRLGVTWDVFGDSTMKAFAQVGRYHLAMPNNVALRGAAGSLYTQEYFQFDSIDPDTGIPQGLTPLGDGPYSSNREYGQAPAPETVAAQGLESHYQDELVVGFEKQISSSLNFGARYVYRDLQNAIDDVCDGRAAYQWAMDNGYSDAVGTSLSNQLQNCRLFNPGTDNTFRLDDGTGNLLTVDLSADQLGFPELKRVYQAVDLFIEHPFDGTWYYKIDYTWSKNYGNAEGQLKSDVGQGDVSMTMDWDHPELMENMNGNLPNDRRHYLKAFGYYQMNDQWQFSGTLIAHSGRPTNCFGYYNGASADDPDFHAYAGPYYGYCNNEPSYRGSGDRLPWTTRLDLGMTYSPSFVPDNRLKLSVDVFNVLDKQVEQSIVEYGELGGPGVAYTSTGRVISYSEPRSVRFTLRYDF